VTVTEGTDTLTSKPLGECCPVRAPATAKLTVPNLGLGEHILVAHYLGNGSFAPIDSPPLAVDVIDANNVSIGDVALWVGPKGTRHTAFKVVLSKPSPVPVTVNYEIANGTAVNGIDFVAPNGGIGTVTIPKAGLAATISVPIIAHNLNAANKTFTVTLTGATGGYTLGKATGVGTMLRPVLTSWFGVADVTVPEGDSGTTHNVLIPITRADPSTRASITLTILPETATSGSKANGNDFVGGKLTRTLTFDVGVVQRTLTIPINRDNKPEGDEFFTVSLGNSSISPDQLTGHVTILGE
jgi:hypothetical protein